MDEMFAQTSAARNKNKGINKSFYSKRMDENITEVGYNERDRRGSDREN